jgi:hypothetical protein
MEKEKCERCGFNGQALHIHHKDRNHKNNKIDNLEVLCANCHHIEHREESIKRIMGSYKRKQDKIKMAKDIAKSMGLKTDRKKAEDIIKLFVYENK